MFGINELIKTASTSRASRVKLVVLMFLVPGVILFIIGLAWGFWNDVTTVDSSLWALPLGLGVLLIALAPASPMLPLWPLNVPDNQVWMLLDGTDHLQKFVPSGLHRIQPIQGFEQFTERGMIPIEIELPQVLTNDHFPYRVLIHVNATLNPLKADPSMLGMLHTIKKEGLAAGMRADIAHIVKQHLLSYGRAEIDPQVLVKTIGDAISEAITARSGLGIGLMPGNSIKINMEPPPEVLAARNELWAEESKAQMRIAHMAEILKLAGATNMSVGDLGRLNFFLNPQPGMRINFQGSHDPFTGMGQQSSQPPAQLPAQPNFPQLPSQSSAAPDDFPHQLPPIQLPKLEAPVTTRQNFDPPNQPRYGRNQPEPPPNLPEPLPIMPTRPPEAPEAPPRQPDSGVIDTVQDEDGTYIPANPILRKKKKKDE